jgi:hypothetical protein
MKINPRARLDSSQVEDFRSPVSSYTDRLVRQPRYKLKQAKPLDPALTKRYPRKYPPP